MMLVGLDQRVLADTADAATGNAFAFPTLIAAAEASRQATAMVLLRDRLYQLVLVPVLAPLPIAWAVVGVRVGDVVASDLNRLTNLQVSFLTRQGDDAWRLQASTLLEVDRGGYAGALAAVAQRRVGDRRPAATALLRAGAFPPPATPTRHDYRACRRGLDHRQPDDRARHRAAGP